MKHLKTTLALFGVVLATLIAFPAHAVTDLIGERWAGEEKKKDTPLVSKKSERDSANTNDSRRLTSRRPTDQELLKKIKPELDAITDKLDTLPKLCSSSENLLKKAQIFQTTLIEIDDGIKALNQKYRLPSYLIGNVTGMLGFHLNLREFNYRRKLPTDPEKLREYFSTLALSFGVMYRVAYNISGSTTPDQFPEGWPRSIGQALVCLSK